MELSPTRVADYADGRRCGKCHQLRHRGLCPCERDERALRTISELEAWQAKVGDVEGIDIRATVGAVISREMRRAGWNGRTIIPAQGDDPNAQATMADLVRIPRQKDRQGDAKRDPFRWKPYRRQVANDDPMPA